MVRYPARRRTPLCAERPLRPCWATSMQDCQRTKNCQDSVHKACSGGLHVRTMFAALEPLRQSRKLVLHGGQQLPMNSREFFRCILRPECGRSRSQTAAAAGRSNEKRQREAAGGGSIAGPISVLRMPRTGSDRIRPYDGSRDVDCSERRSTWASRQYSRPYAPAATARIRPYRSTGPSGQRTRI